MNKIGFLVVLMALPFMSLANKADSTWMAEHYTKKELYILMRDGVRLFTTIYQPNDNKTDHPILLNRTPYSIGP